MGGETALSLLPRGLETRLGNSVFYPDILEHLSGELVVVDHTVHPDLSSLTTRNPNVWDILYEDGNAVKSPNKYNMLRS